MECYATARPLLRAHKFLVFSTALLSLLLQGVVLFFFLRPFHALLHARGQAMSA